MNTKIWIAIFVGLFFLNVSGAYNNGMAIMNGSVDLFTYLFFALGVGFAIYVVHALHYKLLPQYRIDKDMKNWRDR